MVGKKLFIGVFALLFAMQFVVAIDTEITVKTMPFGEVQLTTFVPDNSAFTKIQGLIGNANNYGDINLTHTSDAKEFSIIVYIKKNGESVVSKRFDEIFTAGEPIYLEVFKTGFTPVYAPTTETVEDSNSSEEEVVVNETEEVVLVNESVDSGAEEVEDNSSIVGEEEGYSTTGAVVSSFGTFIRNKNVYYFIGGVLIIVLVFFGMKKIKSTGNNQEIKIRKLSDFKKESEDAKARIVSAEEKIKEAQSEIERVRNSTKIVQARKKLAEDEEELKKLEKEDTSPKYKPVFGKRDKSYNQF